jgi:hypothetical protein
MSLIARGRPEGLNCFRDTPSAFFNSLLPALSLLVSGLVESLLEGSSEVVRDLPGTVCVLLAPAVLSYELARLWGREAFWNRYIVAFNWCQWLFPLIGLTLLVVLTLAQPGADVNQGALKMILIFIAFYALWLNWFLARHGLALSRWRSAALVVLVNLGTVAIVFGPTMLAHQFQ